MKKQKLLPAILVLLGALVATPSLHALEGGYKDGLFIKTDDGDYSLKTNLHFQFQHQLLSVEPQSKTNGVQIRRARINFSGNAFGEDLTYLFNFRFVDGRTNNVSDAVAYSTPNLLDGYVNYKFFDGLQVKVGQYKVPFGLEELIPDTALQFIDRSLSNDVFSFNRDMGITVHGRVMHHMLYSLFLMNDGTSINTQNRNDEMLIGGRLVHNILGDHGITSGDPADTEEPQWMMGMAGTYNRVGQPAAADQDTFAMTGDTAFRYRGFSALGAFYHFRNQDAGTNAAGFLGQTGYFIIPKRLEAMARFAGVMPRGGGGGATNGYEVGGGLGYNFRGHNFKIVADYSLLINSPLELDTDGTGADTGTAAATNMVTSGAMGAPGAANTGGFNQDQNDHRFRTQLQVFF